MKHFKQMDISTEKKYRLINYNFKLILFVIAAMIMGSITICSVRPDFLTKQLIGVSACIIGMIVVSLIDYNFICKYYMVLYVINIGLLFLVLVAGSGGGDTGVHRWFYISDSFTIQPSEFAKIILILCTAAFLEKNYEKVYRELKAIRKVCENVRLKVILETGELKDLESIFNASLIAAYAGADFIKTSTGKVPVNATPESVYVMCEAIRQYYAQTGKRIGLKVAGGVSKAQNAIRYLTIVNHVLGCEWLTPYYFRIGASQLMDDIVKEIKALQMIK